MEIDKILLLRTIILFLPFILVFAYFNYKVKDNFFLKPRAYIQLNIIMICLIIIFVELVYWNISLVNYGFLSFFISSVNTSNTILVLLGTVAAVLGWLFTCRSESLNATRTHSIQTLMESRLSEVYIKQVECATEIFIRFKKKYGENYNLSVKDFSGLNATEKNSIHYLLNYMEFVAVGIRFGDLDENLMKNMMKSIIRTNYTFFENIIKDKQIKAPSVYEHLTTLNKRWNC